MTGPGDDRVRRGRAVEERVAAWLARRGFIVLARNFRTRGGEIDIVAREGETLVFVEVRSRREGSPWSPEASVGPRKQARIARAAVAWLRRHGGADRPCRFDVVAVRVGEGRLRVHHVRGAFTL